MLIRLVDPFVITKNVQLTYYTSNIEITRALCDRLLKATIIRIAHLSKLLRQHLGAQVRCEEKCLAQRLRRRN